MTLTTIASGSSGNCSLLRAGDACILIDAGISARRIASALSLISLSVSDLTAVLITHEHGDHIGGIKSLSGRYGVPVYSSKLVAEYLTDNLQLSRGAVQDVAPGEEFSLGAVSVTAFSTPHDSVQSLGFRISSGGITLGYCTDLGYADKSVIQGLSGADACLIECNHDVDMLKYGSYPPYLKRRILSKKGHLSNACCGELSARLYASGTRSFILAHLSRENNTPEKAQDTVSEALSKAGVRLTEGSVLVAPDVGPLEVEIHKGGNLC